ncbi:hypothetical protein, partial [Thorsellia kenyensis]
MQVTFDFGNTISANSTFNSQLPLTTLHRWFIFIQLLISYLTNLFRLLSLRFLQYLLSNAVRVDLVPALASRYWW